LIRPAWDSCERYRPVLFAAGSLQDRHEELDGELLDACVAHDSERAALALHDHLQLADDIFVLELKGRSIFAF
jgi:DNA-binding GntR family transcriptional regulator